MELKVSRPIQILVLVLVIAGVAGIASMSVLGKSSGAASGSAPLSVAQVRARAHKATPVAAKPAAKPAVTPAKHHALTPPKPVLIKRAAPKRPKVTVAANGLPIVLVDALRSHRIVVVSVFDPQSKTDAVSYAEARAAAGDTGAGFIGASVLDDSVAGPLTAALPGGGLLPVPGVLVYRSPGVLVERIDGFQDRTGVAQVIVAARTATAVAAATTATATTPTPAAAP